MVRRGVVLLALAAASGLATATGAPGQKVEHPIDPERLIEHVKFLASDELGGRANGSEGLERAADYIARTFAEAGLEPGGERDTYFQPFQIESGIEIESENRLRVTSDGQDHSFALGHDYFPLSIAGFQDPGGARPESVKGLPLVFAGYGISARELGYDDYAGIDVAGAAVLLLTHEPQEAAAASPFNGAAPTSYSAVRRKAAEARERSARLVLLVEDASHAPERIAYDLFLRGPQAELFSIPVIRVRRQALERILAGIDLERIGRQIDETLAPASRRIDGVTVEFAEHYTKAPRRLRNVIGVLRGADPARAGEAVVLGAHYDHLGLGGRFSLAAGAAGEIHNGADDNASGTAALIEVARVAAARSRDFPRTLVFVAFAGEELGLRGSAFYANRPVIALDRTTAMLNLDMIGRAHGRLLISGLARVPSLEADLRAASEGLSLQVDAFSEGPGDGSSDDASFVARGVPAIGFFSGFHDDYHRPSDDWARIDVRGTVDVAAITLELARRIAARAEMLELR